MPMYDDLEYTVYPVCLREVVVVVVILIVGT